ncbi:MAG: TipAS antibiotic-recognition domain-containing protein [Terracidiphilus sp.]|jgi:DNA-binding transcriptional MerR regulator
MKLSKTYQIHQFAELTGVTVKALHHYDRLGLLKPQRARSGYRLYVERDLERLEQIVALKYLGFPLQQIKVVLDRAPLNLPEALRMQRQALAEKQKQLTRAIKAIAAAEKALDSGKTSNPAILKRLIEVINMQSDIDAMKKYYSEEAWAKVAPRYEEDFSREWIDLCRDVEAALGEDPASDKAQALVARWMALSSSDPEVREGAMIAWADRNNWPAAMRQRIAEYHLDKIAPFIGQAMTAYRKKYYSDEAWAKIMSRPEEERAQLYVSWRALWQEVAAALDEDPASDKAQELSAKWAELAERSSGGDPEIRDGNIKEWTDHNNWPDAMRQHIAHYKLDKVAPFIGQAMTAYRKKYFSDEAWEKVSKRPGEEKLQLYTAWSALFHDVAAALDEDPAGDKAQQLCARWADLAEKSSGGDPAVKAGISKEWADHKNLPAAAQQRISSFRLEELVAFIAKAYAFRAKKLAENQ